MDNLNATSLDRRIVAFARQSAEPIVRWGLFIVFFWFGMLKVVGQSPISPLVEALFQRTIPYMNFSTFIVLFGIFECLLGILFLIRGAERLAIIFLAFHMLLTFLPLVLLIERTWSGFLVPTMEGHYIIKNILIIGAALTLVARSDPSKGIDGFAENGG